MGQFCLKVHVNNCKMKFANMYKSILLLLLLTIFISCGQNINKPSPVQEVRFKFTDLEKADKELFESMGIGEYVQNDSTLEWVKKVIITNNIYDTLFIPVRDTLCPILMYSKTEQFEFDGTKTSNIIFTGKGFDIVALKNDTTSVFLLSPDIRIKHLYFVTLIVDSLGTKSFKEFSFAE